MTDPFDQTFLDATMPIRPELRLHCYRMLGSSHDSDDVVQETLLRAWRSRASLKDPARVRPWLYRIATNVCLDELGERPRRALPVDAHPAAADPRAPIAPAILEPVWLEPAPDAWLSGVGAADPASRYALKESVALAFVAALQTLTPVQRAALLLRDVVGLSAEETAAALEVSVAAANSALFRARAAVEARFAGPDRAEAAPSAREDVDEVVLAEYVRALEHADIDALVALFRDDMKTTMPPSPTWVHGRAANAVFYRDMFARNGPGAFRFVRTAANGQPALAFYRPTPEGPHALRAIELLETRDGGLRSIHHFMMPEIFALFDVPAVFPAV
jgi:RNA polymerase sigma-70 factor, ECF subfamily